MVYTKKKCFFLEPFHEEVCQFCGSHGPIFVKKIVGPWEQKYLWNVLFLEFSSPMFFVFGASQQEVDNWTR